jgi:hypothetical protein
VAEALAGSERLLAWLNAVPGRNAHFHHIRTGGFAVQLTQVLEPSADARLVDSACWSGIRETLPAALEAALDAMEREPPRETSEEIPR